MAYEFRVVEVNVPDCDCDILLLFPRNRQKMTIQVRPSNADLNYAGSLDILLPEEQPVTMFLGEDMEPAEKVGNKEHVRTTDQITMELP